MHLVLPNSSLVTKHHRIQEVQHVQVSYVAAASCLLSRQYREIRWSAESLSSAASLWLTSGTTAFFKSSIILKVLIYQREITPVNVILPSCLITQNISSDSFLGLIVYSFM